MGIDFARFPVTFFGLFLIIPRRSRLDMPGQILNILQRPRLRQEVGACGSAPVANGYSIVVASSIWGKIWCQFSISPTTPFANPNDPRVALIFLRTLAFVSAFSVSGRWVR
jgi:hypothetical protein